MWCIKCGYGSDSCKFQQVEGDQVICPQCRVRMTNGEVTTTNPHKVFVKGAGSKKKAKKKQDFFDTKDPDASDVKVMDYSKL